MDAESLEELDSIIRDAEDFHLDADYDKYIVLMAQEGDICELSKKHYDDIFDLLEGKNESINRDIYDKYFPYLLTDSGSDASKYEFFEKWVDFSKMGNRVKLSVLLCNRVNLFCDSDLKRKAQAILDSKEVYNIRPLYKTIITEEYIKNLRLMLLISPENYLRS